MSYFSQLPSEEPLDTNLDGAFKDKTFTGHEGLQVMDAALAERLQLEELNVDDEEVAALALQFAEYEDNPPSPKHDDNLSPKASDTAVPQREESESSTDSASVGRPVFETAFPHGFKVLQTPGTNLRCGLYAIILSYENQYAFRSIFPTIDTLMFVVESPAYRNVVGRPQTASNAHEASLMADRPRPVQQDRPRAQRKTRSQTKEDAEDIGEFLQNDRYFSPDQLDLLLRLWGEKHGLRLRLGYLHGQDAKLLGRSQNDERADVVWIHFRSKGAGHYSGLAAKSENEPPPGGGGNRARGNGRGRGGDRGGGRGGKKKGGKGWTQQTLAWR